MFLDPPAHVQMMTSKVKGYITSDVRLRCISLTELEPTRVWTKLGGTMPPKSRIKEMSEYLVISKAQFSDSGVYKCSAATSAGSMSVTGEIILYGKLYS